jgi:hypothetical protein
MSQCLPGCDGSPCENPALQNPIRALRKDWSKNRIPAVKKEGFGFYTRSFFRLRTLTARRDPSVRRKTFANTTDTRFLSFWGNTTQNGRGIDALLTVSHLFWPNDRRRTAFSLPIWLPNPNFLRSEHNGLCRTGGGGVGQAWAGKSARSIAPHRILSLISLPCPVPLKKNALRDSGAIPSHLS